jgi:phage host-nuclease inhibitor protein Gam
MQEDPLTAWRRSCEAKSIAELQEALDRDILNREKAAIARTVIGEKREQQRQQGEIADLKRENAHLKTELRDKRMELRVAWIAVLATLVIGIRSELIAFVKGAWVAAGIGTACAAILTVG